MLFLTAQLIENLFHKPLLSWCLITPVAIYRIPLLIETMAIKRLVTRDGRSIYFLMAANAVSVILLISF